VSLETHAALSALHGIKWTNRSVLDLAGDEDPVAAIQRMARDKVLEAIDAGWTGPPFNPIHLADFMQIRVEPKASVTDARTVSYNDGIKIEFNPLQTRARLRFSIAHEVAHTLFADVGEAVRHRGGDLSGDEWQLEMLCNLAAAEFIMPVGSLPPMEELPPIEKLMEERRRFDVSTEAFLIRATKVTSDRVLMFCASPLEEGENLVGYRVDYIVTSRAWPRNTPMSVLPPKDTVLRNCTAIGYSARAEEAWANLGRVAVECVGIPPYPGARLPRVAGLIRGMRPREGQLAGLQYVHGDVLDPQGAGPKIVCQLVNDSARRWGGGVALQAGRRFPNAQKAFALWASSIPPSERLGKVFFGEVGPGLTLASLVAQKGFGPSDSPRIRYLALEECLRRVANEAIRAKATVHLPRIGLGEARGTWPLIEGLLCDEFVARGVSATVHDLPPKGLHGSQSLFGSTTK
jgi:IrrE N-terminal-like domain